MCRRNNEKLECRSFPAELEGRINNDGKAANLHNSVHIMFM